MTRIEGDEARARLKDAIHFRRKGLGYWCPDLLVDRHAIALVGVEYHLAKDEDEVLKQFSGKACVSFAEPSLET